MATRHLTEFEGLTLLGVEYLNDLRQEAHGNSIWYWIDDTAPDLVSRSGVYHALTRLTNEDFLNWREGAPMKLPGGRRRVVYFLTSKGHSSLNKRRHFTFKLYGRTFV